MPRANSTLPMTAGMRARTDDAFKVNGKSAGLAQYESYLSRARFKNIVQQTENGVLGLAFGKNPEIETPLDKDKVTNNGQLDITSLAKSQLRSAMEEGSGVMVVDAPLGGGDPYITEYPFESLVNWAVADDDDSKYVLVKLKETYFQDDDPYKAEPETRYREYALVDGKAQVSVKTEKNELIGDVVSLPLDYIPVFLSGSVDTLPTVDPIPLLPVADAAIRCYQISADYGQFIYTHGQGTHWATGVSEDEQENILKAGLGVGSILLAENDNAKFGVASVPSGNANTYRDAIGDELKEVAAYAVAITSDGGGIESAEALRIRSATQHATIYTILNSVSEAVTNALACMAEWSGKSGDTLFQLSADFTPAQASHQMLNALNSTINAGNLPVELLYRWARDEGLTDMTDDQLKAATLDGGGTAFN